MPDQVFRVSQVDVFREWEENPEGDLDSLLKSLYHNEPTEDMKRGTAFHAALESMKDGEVDRIESQGFTFFFDGDYAIPSFPIREIRHAKNYSGLVISGQVDGVCGNHIMDHKASTWFDAERYFKKYQWRYYLDIFKAYRFSWYVWEMQEMDEPRNFMVRDLHILEQFRYPDMEQDCKVLAMKLKLFAEQYLIEELA